MANDIIKMAKSMKREFIEITNNYISGTDVNRGTFSIIYQGSPDYYIGTLAELEGKKQPDYWKPEEMVKSRLDYLKEQSFLLTSRDPIMTIDNLKDDESFLDIVSNKAADGANIYGFNKQYLMYTFSSLHPLNKPDVISCSIYPVDNISYLAQFVINKKKWVIYEYIRYLYL